jgi:nicotinate phosphoribosyltransferase
MSALNTDLYELTMAAGYFVAGKANDQATFELSVRRLPEQRNFLITAGLQQAVDYLTSLRFDPEEIRYLRSLDQFRRAPAEFFDYLSTLRFTGDVFAMPEGTPAFAGEPIMIVRAPLVQAQLVETYLLSTISFQTTIASKAARCILAAQGRQVVEFGSRRAHSPEAGPLAARAAFLAGCVGTSNTQAGMLFGIPVFGTAAHSWTMAFGDEKNAFHQLQALLGEHTVYLVDTYDTVEATRLAIRIGPPFLGVRLDSGDLVAQAKEVRRLLDNGGFPNARIIATSDLNEERIASLLAAGAPIDAFGVGTDLATSADSPSLSAIYKLVELQAGESHSYTAKYSDQKSTLPGAKQVYRYRDHDLIALYSECRTDDNSEPLLRPFLVAGEMLESYPRLSDIRERATQSIRQLPAELLDLRTPRNREVRISEPLLQLAGSVRNSRYSVIS